MSLLYYKGKVYGKTKTIKANKHQLIVGDGKQWAAASPFSAKEIEYTTDTSSYIDNYLGTNNKEDSLIIGLDPEGEVGEKGFIRLKNNSKTTLAEDSQVIVDGTSQVYLHNNAFFVMDNTGDQVGQYGWDGEKNNLGNGSDGGPVLFLHDKSSIIATQGGSLKLAGKASIVAEGEGFLKVGGILNMPDPETGLDCTNLKPQVCIEDGQFTLGRAWSWYNTETQISKYTISKPQVFLESGILRLGGLGEKYNDRRTTDYPVLKPQVFLESGFLRFGEYKDNIPEDSQRAPIFIMNGGCSLIMNSYNRLNEPLEDNDTGLDPVLIISPNSFVYEGQGATGARFEADGDLIVDNTTFDWKFESSNFFNEETKRNPRINIADDTCVIMNGGFNKTGKNWIQFAADDDKQVYFQVTSNPFFEINHDSIFQMKGADTKNQPPWNNIEHRGNDNGPTFKMLGEPGFESITDRYGDVVTKIYSKSSFSLNGAMSGSMYPAFITKTIRNSVQSLSGNALISGSSYTADFEIKALYSEPLSIISILIVDNTAGTAPQELMTEQNLQNISNSSNQIQVGGSIQTDSSGQYITDQYGNKICNINISTDNTQITLGALTSSGQEKIRKIIIHYDFAVGHDYTVRIRSDKTAPHFYADLYSTTGGYVPSIASSNGGSSALEFNTSNLSNIMPQRFIGIESNQGIPLVIGNNSITGKYGDNSSYISIADAAKIDISADSSIVLSESGSSLKLINKSIICNSDNSYLKLSNGGSVTCDQGGSVFCQMGSRLSLTNGGSVTCDQGGSLSLTVGGRIDVSGGSSITLNNAYTIKGSYNSEDKDQSTISFGSSSAEDSVTFTLAELRQLKALLNS